MSSLCQNPQKFVHILFSIIILGNSASHFLDDYAY